MAVNIKFDLIGNPEPPTIILATRNGNKLGQLDVNQESIELTDRLNDASEFTFTLNKYVNGELTNLWDKVTNFKLVYCKEWDCWFEITVELDEETEAVKTVFCTQLGQAELSQLMLYNIEINTEDDIARDDYKITILYDSFEPEASLLHRLLKDKAPHYSIYHVDSTLERIQRSFSFDDISIYDAFQEIAEEIGCLFVFHSNSDENMMPQRLISVYDLQQNCLNDDCKYRGEFTDVCPECGSINIKNGYGEDTLIFVTSDELASSGIQFTTDTDAVKNCFKLEAGDDLMTATIRNCNPNGSDYIWYFSNSMKEDMTDDLIEGIDSYNEKYEEYYNDYESELDNDLVAKYNNLVDKYSIYNEELQKIELPIKGYSSLMKAYYNVIDLDLYLKSSLMPNIEINKTTAKDEAEKLRVEFPISVAVANAEIASLATANSAVLAMAKIIVRSNFKIQVDKSELTEDNDVKYWNGNFIISNYSDDEDTAVSEYVSVRITDDLEEFIEQKIDKILNREDTDDLSVTGLIKKNIDSHIADEDGNSSDCECEFCNELKKYALNPLTSFHDACQSCIDILIEQGVGNKDGDDTWSDTDSGSESNLYETLYIPYYTKLKAIESEMKVREDEIIIVSGEYDKDGKLISNGLKTDIEKCRNLIQSALNFQEHLGESLWNEFCSYRREDKYSNSNYISDGLNNAELFKRALEFVEVAENEIFKSAELQHSISTTLNNLLAMPKFKPLINSFKVGNWIRVRVDDKLYKLRLIEYGINFGDFNNISVEFSDVTRIKNGITDVEDILSQASAMATSYGSVQHQAKQGNNAQNMIGQWLSEGLNSALVQIQNNDSEEITFDKNGLLGRSYSDITGTYSPKQIRLTHNIIAYTSDNWESVRLAIGEHDYHRYDTEKDTFVKETGYGINADFMTAGVVSGSQIIGGHVYSDNYSVTDSKGSYMNLRDGTFSFGGGALRFVIDKETGKGSLYISSDEVDSHITEITDEYLKTTTVYAENLLVNAAKVNGELTAATINANKINSGELKGHTIIGGSIQSENYPEDENGNPVGSYMNLNNGDFSFGGGELTFSNGVLSAPNLHVNAANIDGKLTVDNIELDLEGTITWKDLSDDAKDSIDDRATIITENYIETEGISADWITVGALDANIISVNGALQIFGYDYDYDEYMPRGFMGDSGSLTQYNGVALSDNTGLNYCVVTEGGVRLSYRDENEIWVSNGGCYSSSTMQVWSDKRLKNDIDYNLDIEEKLFTKLKPCSFKMNNDLNKKKHWGFVAQDVISASKESGLDVEELAVIANYNEMYSIGYGEITALNTHMIQKLMARVDDIESRL